MVKKIFSFAVVFVLILSLFGCAGVSNDSENSPNSSSANVAENVEEKDYSDMFSNRDKEIGYDENNSTKINLNEKPEGVTITAEGTYILTGTLENGQVVIDADKTAKIQIVLDGVNINCNTSASIYIKQADKVFITLANGSENILSNKAEFVAIDDNNIDGVIFSKDDLTLNGEGKLTINANFGNAIVSKDDLVITGGEYILTSQNHALEGKDCVKIADGKFTITSGKDAIHAENSDDASLGYVYIEGGKFDITSGDDAIHAETEVLIANGEIDIKKSYEGIEGQTIKILDGNINLIASDDGLNASSGSSSTDNERPQNPFETDENTFIEISGGLLNINANGDGIDSNGNLIVTGGETYISGPTNSGNGALDYAGVANISNGVFIATGMSGMAQNFGNQSTQCSIMVNLQSSSKDTVILKDSSGDEIISYTPTKEYNSVVISHPQIKADGTYTITAGETSQAITMQGIIYGSGMGGFGGGMRNPMQDGKRPTRPEGEVPYMPNGEMPQKPQFQEGNIKSFERTPRGVTN